MGAVRNPDEIFVKPEQMPSACQGELHPMAVMGIESRKALLSAVARRPKADEAISNSEFL